MPAISRMSATMGRGRVHCEFVYTSMMAVRHIFNKRHSCKNGDETTEGRSEKEPRQSETEVETDEPSRESKGNAWTGSKARSAATEALEFSIRLYNRSKSSSDVRLA